MKALKKRPRGDVSGAVVVSPRPSKRRHDPDPSQPVFPLASRSSGPAPGFASSAHACGFRPSTMGSTGRPAKGLSSQYSLS
ncbi:hypothetical protein SKAU_G00119890 [Synaphobranchus kaupii]|uniref:Uncharacterized protein n=1 Tax=Synaphobranchus kaupii TaxID=118154 RepID=A0A9Q1FP45_SYNKA|nr:hypothetical protein SKAU_G00119890 [Synaphobranchus kaupii]